MLPGQTLFQSTSRILTGLEPCSRRSGPKWCWCRAIRPQRSPERWRRFYLKIPVGHVEAGLRTGDIYQPFPEEANRLLATRLATLHFAATEWAAENLLNARECAREAITVTGNTGIDAVLYVRDELAGGPAGRRRVGMARPEPQTDRRDGAPAGEFRRGFRERSAGRWRVWRRGADVQIVYPVHPNPNVQEPVNRHLRELENVHLIEPVSYVPFVDLMRRAYMLVTDSGGIQEEGPSLGKPILVLREKTERPEAVEAGTVRLVGSDEDRIVDSRHPPARRRGRVRRDGARSQPLRRWPGQRANCGRNSFLFQGNKVP